jgi:hypothetical protein
MAIRVDYYQQIVFITSPTTTVTVQQLLDAMREAEDSPEGLAFGGPVKTVTDGFVDGEGEADLGGGFATPLTITLDDNWYIEFWDGVSLGTINDGNVSGGKDGRPVRCAVGSSDTALVLGAERGVITAGGVSQSDIDAMADAVWDEPKADHTDSGSFGEELVTPPTVSEIATGVWENAAALRLLGLTQENQYIDQTSYNGAGHLTSARIRLYSNPSSVGTDSDVIATYTMTAVWSGDEMTSYKMVKS